MGSCRDDRERRKVLKKLLYEHIQIAERLSKTEGSDSPNARWAWDVTEEITRKLNRVEDMLYQSNIEEWERTRQDIYDEQMSRREYDL